MTKREIRRQIKPYLDQYGQTGFRHRFNISFKGGSFLRGCYCISTDTGLISISFCCDDIDTSEYMLIEPCKISDIRFSK